MYRTNQKVSWEIRKGARVRPTPSGAPRADAFTGISMMGHNILTKLWAVIRNASALVESVMVNSALLEEAFHVRQRKPALPDFL